MPRWIATAALGTFFVCAGPVFAAPPGAAEPASAPSAEDVRAAAEEFDLGKKAYKQKAWIEAAEHFEKADARAPSAVVLELAMKARDKAGQLDRAATLAAFALERHPDQAELAKSAQPLVKKAEGQLHKLRVRCTPACELVIGTKLVHGRAVSERSLFLEAGTQTVHAGWSGGRTRSSPVQAAKGGSSELAFEAPTEEKPAEAAPKNADSTTPTPVESSSQPVEQDAQTRAKGLPPSVFWVGVGLTAIAGGITIWSGIDTQNNPGKDTVREQCVGQGEDCPEYQDGLKRQRRTNILLGVTGGLAVVTGVVGAFFTNWHGSGTREQASVEPFIGIGAGASLGARGRF